MWFTVCLVAEKLKESMEIRCFFSSFYLAEIKKFLLQVVKEFSFIDSALFSIFWIFKHPNRVIVSLVISEDAWELQSKFRFFIGCLDALLTTKINNVLCVNWENPFLVLLLDLNLKSVHVIIFLVFPLGFWIHIWIRARTNVLGFI